MCFDFCFCVDREGRGGGIAILWRKYVDCSITNYSQNHVDIEVQDNIRGRWRLTGFYGFPEGGRRRESWNFLRQLANLSQLPVCVIGDFNDILHASEKKRRADRPNWLINGFREAVSDAGLVDFRMEGYEFTWFKSLGTERAVEEKMDRSLANKKWFDIFPNGRLECLATTSSDHYPLLLECIPEPKGRIRYRNFHFENSWLIEPEFTLFVVQQWESYGSNTITHKLDQCEEDLQRWSKENCQPIRKEIEKFKRKLEKAKTRVGPSNIYYFNAIRKRLDVLLVKDDVF